MSEMVKTNGNKPYVEKMQNIRRSNAAGKHGAKHNKRAKTRGAACRRAIRREMAAH